MPNIPVDLILPTRANRCNPVNFIKEYNRWTHLICLQIKDGKKLVPKLILLKKTLALKHSYNKSNRDSKYSENELIMHHVDQ